MHNDTQTDITTAATLRHDPNSHYYWLDFVTRPDDDTRAALKRAGWRWSSYREQWRSNRRNAPYSIPAGITVEDGGECDYSSERSDRLTTRADAHYAQYQEKHAKAHARASRIPFGQPILVGHHSQRRHERDLDRIHNDYGKAFAEYEKSRDLRERAASSARFQAYKQTAPAMARRVERLRVEERQLQRKLADPAIEQSVNYADQCRRNLDKIQGDIAELELSIAEAGGLMADQVQVQKGDLVRMRGGSFLVSRVNAKSYSGVIAEGPVMGWRFTWARCDFQGIIARADEPQAQERREALAKLAQQKRETLAKMQRDFGPFHEKPTTDPGQSGK